MNVNTHQSHTLANITLNLVQGQSQVVRLFGSPFNAIMASVVYGVVEVYLGGSVGNNPDFVFGPTGSPTTCDVGTVHETQITLYNPYSITVTGFIRIMRKC